MIFVDHGGLQEMLLCEMLTSSVQDGVIFQHTLVKRFSYSGLFFFRWRKCRCLQLLLKCSSVPLICPSEPSLVKLQPAN